MTSYKVIALYESLKAANVLDDRREYDEEDVKKAYPTLTEREVKQLYNLFQN